MLGLAARSVASTVEQMACRWVDYWVDLSVGYWVGKMADQMVGKSAGWMVG